MVDTVVNGIALPFVPAQGIEGLRERPTLPLPPDRAFDNVLQKELQDLKFSRHAQERLSERNITLNETDLAKLQSAVDRADQKGAQDSLVLLRDVGFIVSVRNRTVVTAVAADNLKENVFTKIDSAVIAG